MRLHPEDGLRKPLFGAQGWFLLEKCCCSFGSTPECSFDMLVGRVSGLVSYFDTCQTHYLDPVQDISELLQMLPCLTAV